MLPTWRLQLQTPRDSGGRAGFEGAVCGTAVPSFRRAGVARRGMSPAIGRVDSRGLARSYPGGPSRATDFLAPNSPPPRGDFGFAASFHGDRAGAPAAHRALGPR